MNIWKIEETLSETLTEIELNGGELTPELEKSLDIGRENLAEKLYQLDKMNKIAVADLDAIAKEMNRLNELATVRANFIQNLEKVVTHVVEKFGVKDEKSKAKHLPVFIPFDLGEVRLTKTESVEINALDNLSELDPYLNASVTINNLKRDSLKETLKLYPNAKSKIEYSKTQIKEALEKGVELKHARIITNSKLKWK